MALSDGYALNMLALSPPLTPQIYDSPDLVASLFARCTYLNPSNDPRGLLETIAQGFSRIPYENATKIIKKATADHLVDRFRGPVELLEQYRDYGAGGTCFSLVHCLRMILKGFGYTNYVAMADMHHGSDIHCAIIVTLGAAKVLLDPGYLIPYPVTLPPVGHRVRSRNYMNEVEYQRSECGRFIDLFTVDASGAKWRYRIKDQPVTEQDFLKHWLRSFDLTMMNSLILTKADDFGQVYLHNDHLRLLRETGKQTRRLGAGFETQVETLFGVSSRIVHQAREILGWKQPIGRDARR